MSLIGNHHAIVNTLSVALILKGIEVDKEFRDIQENFPREINIIRGPVLSDYDIKVKPKRGRSYFFCQIGRQTIREPGK